MSRALADAIHAGVEMTVDTAPKADRTVCLVQVGIVLRVSVLRIAAHPIAGGLLTDLLSNAKPSSGG